MRKVIIIALIMMFVFIGIAQADRLTDLRDRYKTLAAQKLQIESEMIRIEGMFIERQYQVEQKELAKQAQEAEIVEINDLIQEVNAEVAEHNVKVNKEMNTEVTKE